VKQKRQAFAAFLGVLTVPQDVVGGCCISTTILRLLVSVEVHWNPAGIVKPRTFDRWSGLRIMGLAGPSPDLRTGVGAPDKQKAAADAAAFEI
jgi:hypothetical protein